MSLNFRSLRPSQSITHPVTLLLICLLFSHIRETLVKIMASPATRQSSGSMYHMDERYQVDTIAAKDGLRNASGGKILPMDPSTCIFWCAVAVGALVKGSPVELVRTCRLVAYPAGKLGSSFPKRVITASLCCTPNINFSCQSLAPLRSIEWLEREQHAYSMN